MSEKCFCFIQVPICCLYIVFSGTTKASSSHYCSKVTTRAFCLLLELLQFAQLLHSITMKPVVSLELLLCGLTAASHIPRTACKAHPDDGLHWPSQESWASLNHTLGGNLLQPPPPGGVCHPGQSNYEAGQCATVAKEWLTYDFHSRNPISVMSNQFANDTCLPREDSPCSAAGYPAYVIDASTPEHVKQGVDFGMLRRANNHYSRDAITFARY